MIFSSVHYFPVSLLYFLLYCFLILCLFQYFTYSFSWLFTTFLCLYFPSLLFSARLSLYFHSTAYSASPCIFILIFHALFVLFSTLQCACLYRESVCHSFILVVLLSGMTCFKVSLDKLIPHSTVSKMAILLVSLVSPLVPR